MGVISTSLPSTNSVKTENMIKVARAYLQRLPDHPRTTISTHLEQWFGPPIWSPHLAPGQIFEREERGKEFLEKYE
jgi:hypothetical protein